MRFGDVLLFERGKDGGPKSKVDGYWLIRIKGLFSVALLRFGKGSREAFHDHAFNSVSWLLTGGLVEIVLNSHVREHRPGLRPIWIYCNTFHKVYGEAESNWVLTFRGPWLDTWQEIDESGTLVTLTHNRKVVA